MAPEFTRDELTRQINCQGRRKLVRCSLLLSCGGVPCSKVLDCGVIRCQGLVSGCSSVNRSSYCTRVLERPDWQ